MLEGRLIQRGEKLILLCKQCKNEIGIYQSTFGMPKQYCNICIKKHRRKKDEEYYKKTNYWSTKQYREYRRKKRAIKKFNGKPSFYYSQHIYRGNNGKTGKANFQRESEIVKKMKNNIFKFGNGVVLGNFINASVCFNKKIGNKEDLNYYQRKEYIIYSPKNFKCPVCKNKTIIIPEPPHSYDYDKDGFIIKMCANCCLVLEDI